MPEDPKKLQEAIKAQSASLDLSKEQIKLLKTHNIYLDKSVQHHKDRLDNLRRYGELFKERLEGERNINELIEQQNKMRNIQIEIHGARQRELSKDLNDSQREQNRLKAEELILQEKIAAGIEELNSKQDALNKRDRREARAAWKLKDAELRKELQAMAAKKKAKAQEIKDTKKQLDIQTKLRKLKKDEADAQDDLQSSVKQMSKTFLGVDDLSNSFAGQMIEAYKATKDLAAAQREINSGGLDQDALGLDNFKAKEETLKKISQAFNDMTDPLKVSLMVLTKIFESSLAYAKQIDSAVGDFRKTTGITNDAMGDMEGNLASVQRANLRFGVTLEESGAAQAALVTEMSAFTTMNKKAQTQVLKTAVLLQEFGVSADTTAQIFDLFTKGLGYTSDELEDLSLSLMSTADALGMPPQVIFSEFAAASTELAKYGGDMEGVFKGLAEQSKNTGIAIGDLIGITKQFDTFREAGESVGKLNAILGGPYLNAINMVYMTEAQRVKALRDSVKASGRQFDDLERHEKQAIATAAGISDMSKAAKLFGGTNKDFAENAKSMKELQIQAAKAQKVSEKFSQVMMSLAIMMGPVVSFAGLLVDILLLMFNPLGAINDALDGDAGLTAILSNLVPAFMAVIAAIKIYSLTAGTATTLTTGLVGSIYAFAAPLAVGVAAFAAMYKLLGMMPPKIGKVVGALVALAATVALVVGLIPGVGWTIAASSLTSAALVGAAGAGYLAMATYQDGKPQGEKVPGGVGAIAEDGKREALLRGDQAYMVNSPTAMDVKDSDTILNNAQTEQAMGGGAGGAGLEQTVASLAAVVADLKSAVTSANESLGESQTPVQVVMNDKVVGEAALTAVKGALRLGR